MGGELAHQFISCLGRADLAGTANPKEFNDVQPPFPQFKACDIAAFPIQEFRQVPLSQSGGLSQANDLLPQDFVLFGIDGLPHALIMRANESCFQNAGRVEHNSCLRVEDRTHVAGFKWSGGKKMETGVRTLVIVDDTPAVLISLEWMLREEGYRVHAFSRAIAALQFIQTNDVHLVMSDFKMPTMDGLEFATELRKTGWDGVFFFMSGHSEELKGKVSQALKVNHVVQKPFDIFELSERIGEALQVRESSC